MGGGRKSSETEDVAGRGRSRTSSVSDEGGFNEPSPEVVARLRPADYRDPHPPLTSDIRDAERARSDPDTLSVLQQVNKMYYNIPNICKILNIHQALVVTDD